MADIVLSHSVFMPIYCYFIVHVAQFWKMIHHASTQFTMVTRDTSTSDAAILSDPGYVITG